MKPDAGSGGVGRNNRRRGLLLFAFLLVVAQVMLFAFLRVRKEGDTARAAPPTADALSQAALGQPAPQAAPLPTSAPQAATVSPISEPENKTLEQPESGPDKSEAASTDDEAKDDDKSTKERERRERADRERERRDRERAEREREREQMRERARLDAERDRARLEIEKERARLETERAEKARLDAEREKARFEAERASLAAQSKARTAESSSAPAPRQGSPDVLVVVVSARAGGGGLSREQIRNIYFGKTSFWPNNTPVRAYNRPGGSAAGRKFFRSILGTSAGAFREHWNELQLSGGGIAPATVSSAESIVGRVAGSSGAIGYVLESELPADVSGVRLIRFK